MTARLADPARSRIVLIGTPSHRHEGLPDVPEVGNNVADLAAVLVDPELGGFNADHCVAVSATAGLAELGAVLHGSAALAEDLLLIYYAGHGLLDPRGQLHLALAGTHPAQLGFTALPYETLRAVCLDSDATSKVVILDSCFSGRAIGKTLAEEEQQVLGQLEVAGTYTLTSAAGSSVARIVSGEEHTAFTERLLRLLRLLREGDPCSGPVLGIGEVYRRLRSQLRSEGLPEPQQCGTANADLVGLVRNRRPRVLDFAGQLVFASNVAPSPSVPEPELGPLEDTAADSAEEPAAQKHSVAESAPSLGPAIVDPVRYFLLNGDARMAAHWLAGQHANEPDVVGQILAEVGRQSASSVVDLLHTVAEESGSRSADEFLAAVKEADEVTTTAVEAILRTRPYPVTPLPAPVTDVSDLLGILSLDPRAANAKRRAALARRGAIVDVTGEILAEATIERPRFIFVRKPDDPPDMEVSADLALELIVETLREVPEPEQGRVAGAILTEMVAAGHTASACELLIRVASQRYRATEQEIQDLLSTMRRPELLRTLEELADRERNRTGPPVLPAVIGHAPAPVAAEFLLHWYQTTGRVPLKISDLPALGPVLRNMVERSASVTASVLMQDVTDQIFVYITAPRHEWPEAKIASAVLDLARSDVKGAGRLLAVFLTRDGTTRVLRSMREASEAQHAVELTAEVVEAAIKCDPERGVVYIAVLAAADESLIPLLDRVAQINADYGRMLASALLANDAMRLKRTLPRLIRQDATTLAAELLRQVGNHDQSGPWNAAGMALQDGATNVALGILDAHFLGLT